MAQPYITVEDVANSLGVVTWTGPQLAVAEQKVAAAIAYANRITLRRWNLDPITNERYDLREQTLLLRSSPVTSVESIATRSRAVGDTLVTLVALTDYELLDPDQGEVQLARGYGGDTIGFVSYTPNRPVPADVVEAVTMIAGRSLYPTLYSDRWGIAQAQADRETVIKYTDFGDELLIPPKADKVLRGYRGAVWG